ncbi:MAG: lipocalin-like domain-containing protein [Dehalococcoidia bacterium]
MIRPLAILATVMVTAALAACSSPEPTPTPPYGLPPLRLPADEAPHDFQTEWWYFNLQLEDELGGSYLMHDVVFQVQRPDSEAALYVRQIGLADAATGRHATSERLRIETTPAAAGDASFSVEMGDWLMAGQRGVSYRLVAGAGDFGYDLTLTSTGEPLLHDDDGLVDFGPAGISYYYTRPRLEVSGTLSTADGGTIAVTGLGWLDKQWGDFEPVALSWDWASIQLDDGTDLMLSRLFEGKERKVLTLYGTLRTPAGQTRTLGPEDITFEYLDNPWVSLVTGTAYQPAWHVAIPSVGIDVTLEPMLRESEFVSARLGVAYLETGVRVLGANDAPVGQGFVELNWPRGTTP